MQHREFGMKGMNPGRRDVLKRLVGACIAAKGLTWAHAEPAVTTRTPKVGPLPFLFVDDASLHSSTGVKRVFHSATTLANPVITSDKAWEGKDRVYIYGSVYTASEGGYRMWYQGIKQGQRREGKSLDAGLPASRGDLLLYARSQDGLQWEKPALGLYEYDGSRKNNIVYSDVSSPSVLYDLAEKDNNLRYKMMGVRGGNYCSAVSPDGFHWTTIDEKALPGGDTITMAQNPLTGEYLAFHKRVHQVGRFRRRTVWLAKSTDFRAWSTPELVLEPDSQDDTWVLETDQRTEIYDMSVFPHATGLLGLPVFLRIEKAVPSSSVPPWQSPHDGPLDVQFATSVDGRAWRREPTRMNAIPRGVHGKFDAGAILGVSSTAVNSPEETWVFYTAITTGHGAPMPPKRLTIGRAAWRLDGYASLDSDGSVARVETVPCVSGGPQLNLNAIIGGNLQAEIRAEDGTVLPGYSYRESVPFRGSSTASTIRWRGKQQIPRNVPIRLALQWSDGSVFSIRAVG